MKDKIMQVHPIKPVYDENSKILILGSFPSVKSREEMFYYAHPQNRFWKVLSIVLNQNRPKSIEEKIKFLLNNKIALYDAAYSCDISGSSDLSIKNVVPTDLSLILKSSHVKQIFTNGNKAHEIYTKFNNAFAIKLPSTSPANAKFNTQKLIQSWSEILKYL